MAGIGVRWGIGAVVVSVGVGAVARAQSVGACGTVAGGEMVYSSPAWGKAPYRATVKTTREQKLMDGNAIHGSATTHQARDTAGRTMSETSMGCTPGLDGQLQPIVRVTVYDPGKRTTLSWSVSDNAPKVVHVVHQPEPVASPAVQTAQHTAPPVRPQQRVEVHSENLGSKMIAGVMAEGSRTVRTIPAGEQGNDLPIEVVDEVWIAKDLGLAVMRVSDDPRSGKTTTEVVELNQGEPDASLFTAPAGYKLEEQVVKTVSATSDQ
jgi:hypothetical protein